MKSNHSKRLLIAVLAAAIAGPVFATGHKPKPKPQPVAAASAVAVSNAESRSSSHATGGDARASGGTATSTSQGGVGGQGGSATQSQTANGGQANNAGNAQNLSVSEVRQLATAPDAIAPNVYPSASCYHGKSGGVSFGNSGFGAGISGGKDQLDEACDIRETARSFAAIGNYTAANALLCSTPAAVKYLKSQCGDPTPPVAPAPTVLVVPAGISDTEIKEREKRIIEAISGK